MLPSSIFILRPSVSSHPNIIAYHEAFLEDYTSTLCIVMEYATEGDLYQYIRMHQKQKKYVAESQIWNFFIQVRVFSL